MVADMARYRSWTGTVLCILMVMQIGAALGPNELLVGGKGEWSPKGMYNKWAEQTRFRVRDIIVFKYDPSVDSVLEVNQTAYNSCNTSNFNNKYKDGNTSFTFRKHGAFYFISGNAANCQKGEKMVIVVLSPRNPPAPPPTVTSPPPSSVAPSPAPSTAASPPPIAPSPGASPSVAPVASPSVAPAASPTVASVPSEALPPGNSAPYLSSPAPAPFASEGGVVPAPSAGNGIRPCLALAVVALALSGAF